MPVAGAAAIHACVNKRSGATRIVSAKVKRCRRGEQRLSWNTSGPAGPGGADGKQGPPGAPGAGGAVAGFFAAGEPVALAREAVTVIVSKTIPPGSYLVSAKTVFIAEAAAAKNFSSVSCRLTDNPGTSFSPSAAVFDISAWEAVLGEKGAAEFRAVETLPAQGPLTSPVTSTVAYVCVSFSSPATTLTALSTQIAALQTSHNG